MHTIHIESHPTRVLEKKMTKQSKRNMLRCWLLGSVLAFLFSPLPQATAQNPADGGGTPPVCPTAEALSDCPYCAAGAFASAGESQSATTCSKGRCSEGKGKHPGNARVAVGSIQIGIVCGRAPHESTGVGKLMLYAEQPSEDIFSPAALAYSHVLGGAVASVITDDPDWGANVERQVTIMDLSGMPNTFQFLANESVGLPLDSESCSSMDFRLRKIDGNGDATTGTPTYYDFHMLGERKFIRYSASTNEAVGYDNGSGRYIEASATGVEVIKDTEGVIRQVKTATELVDIVIPATGGTTAAGTICKYTITFYPDSDVGEKDEADHYYLLQQGATAHTVITIENPAEGEEKDTDFDQLKLTRAVGGTNYVYEYTYTDASKQWKLGRGAGRPYETLTSQFDDTGKIETKTRELHEGDDTLVSSTIETWVEFDWGTKMVTKSVRTDATDDTALLTTQYLYYDPGTMDAGDSRRDYIVTTTSTAKHGRMHSVRYPTGAWTITDYDDYGRATMVVRPWKDQTVTWNGVSESTITAVAASAHAAYSSYAGVDTNDSPASDDGRPRTITRKIAGTAVGRTFSAYYENTNGEKVEIIEHAATPTAIYGTTGNLRTTTTYYASSAAPASAGRLRTVQSPDGRLDTYTYETGTYTSNAIPLLCSFTAGTGDAFRTTVTHGTVSSPGGVANRTTRETTVQDAYGNQVLTETYVYDGTGYERIDWTVRAYDDRWRPENVYFSSGVSTSTTWGCCGKDSETLADGTEWSYGYDSLLRLTSRTKECGTTDIVTTYTYDAAGRRLTETVTAGGPSLSSSIGYDLAGRTTRYITREGLLTATVYTNGGRTVTTTHPGGGAEIRDSHLDGRAKSSTGTYVTDTYQDYAVDTTTVTGETLQTTTTYQGAIPNGGTSADIPLWHRTYTDPLGQIVRTGKPAYGHTATTPVLAIATRTYDSAGRLSKQTNPRRAATVYEYDSSLGKLLRTGLDLNDDGDLNPVTDRITESSAVCEKDANNDWWHVTTSKVYSVETDDPGTAGTDERTIPLTVSSRSRRLTGLGGMVANLGTLIAEGMSEDVDGNETLTKTYIDTGTKMVVHVIDSPFSATDATNTTVNGLLDQAVSTSNLTTNYLYDDLGRRTGVTDPRVSSYDAQTDTWSNCNETHYNSVGQVDWTKDTAGNQTSYTYDNPPADPTDAQRQAATGRRISTTNALSKTKHTNYTVKGQLYRIWGDTGYPLEYGYDENGRRITLKTYRGGTGWTGTDWPTATAGTADTTMWNYEPETGLLESKEYADGKGPSDTYHSDGSLHTRTWERTVGGSALTATYGYDSDTGQLTGVDYSDTGTTDLSYTYTRTGQAKTVADATGTRTFAYTDENKLSTETLSSSFYGATTALTRNYDALGRDDGYSLSYNGTDVHAPDYSYDAYGRFSSVEEGNDTFTCAYLTNSDLVNTLSGPASTVQTRAYETSRNLVDFVENKVGTTTVSKYDYSNDNLGRRSSVQKSGTAFSQTDTVTWSYDDRSQVTSGDATSDDTYDYTYAYDSIGNRTNSTTKETGTAVTTTYTANQLNQYTVLTSQTNPTYDDDGNMTLMPDAAGDWTLSWDGENRLVRAESSTAKLDFLYDEIGRRVQKKAYTGTIGNWALSEDRRFLYSGSNLIAEFTVDVETVSLDRTHVWGLDLSRSLLNAGGVGGLLRTAEHGTGGAAASYYPTYDANGNVSEYLDSVGAISAHYEYSPFGELSHHSGDMATSFSHRFSTRFQDLELRSYYYGFRYYNPLTGSWLSRDPIDERGGLNLYQSFMCDSVNRIDPHGLLITSFDVTNTPIPEVRYGPMNNVGKDATCCLETKDQWDATGHVSSADCEADCFTTFAGWITGGGGALGLACFGIKDPIREKVCGIIAGASGLYAMSLAGLGCKIACEMNTCNAQGPPTPYIYRPWWPWSACETRYKCPATVHTTQ